MRFEPISVLGPELTWRRCGPLARRDRAAPEQPHRMVLHHTGHPPPHLQGTDQVRTSTGYTLGMATPDGARLCPVGDSGRQTAVTRQIRAQLETEERGARRERDQRDCVDVLQWLRHAETTLKRPTVGRGDLRRIPPLYGVALQIGATCSLHRLLCALERLTDLGELTMVTEAKGRRGAAIRLRGSRLTLITVGFPDDVRLA